SGFTMEIPAETSQGKPIALPDHAALRAIAEGVEAETADRFFSSLAGNLALALRCGTLRGTLCESVLHGEVANPADLCVRLPDYHLLMEWARRVVAACRVR